MGILGFGRIGKQIAKRALGFGDRSRLSRPQSAGRGALSLLSLAPRHGEGVRHLDDRRARRRGDPTFVDREVMAALGPDGVLVNIARGSLVDEAAMIEAMKERRILAAGLDVYENEPNVSQALLELDNVVALPHVGSASRHTRRAMADLVVANLFSWIDGKGPLTPTLETPWRG